MGLAAMIDRYGAAGGAGLVALAPAAPPAYFSDIHTLAQLKEYLQRALSEVEHRERTLSARLKPTSKAEAEALLQELHDAVSEVEALKDRLPK